MLILDILNIQTTSQSAIAATTMEANPLAGEFGFRPVIHTQLYRLTTPTPVVLPMRLRKSAENRDRHLFRFRKLLIRYAAVVRKWLSVPFFRNLRMRARR